MEFQRRLPGAPLWRALFVWTILQRLMLLACKLLYRVQVSGHEYVPPTGPIIYVSNHQSHLDPVLSGLPVFDRPFTPMARSSLFFWPLSWVLHWFGTIPLVRGAGKTGPMKAALQELAAGRCVLVYPEGTRTTTGMTGEFQSGFLLLVKRSGALVVPMAEEGAFDVWPKGQGFPRICGRIAVAVMPAIPAEQVLAGTSEQAIERLRRQIENKRLELRAALRRTTRHRWPARGVADRPYWER